jgi:signal transduction histidine kinase
MDLLKPDRRAIAGGLLGTGVAAAAIYLPGLEGDPIPATVFLVLAIVVAGLALGATAALYAYVGSAAVVIALALVPQEGATTSMTDVLRLAAFVVGSPLVVFLVLRADQEKAAAMAARDASAAAERHALEERAALEATWRELDPALASAERDRARLEEVAEAIPEPLIVYDAEPRGTYGNRAALRLLGRSFFERSIDEWGRHAEPRNDRGSPIPRDEWPQLRAQREPMRMRMTVRIPMSGRDLVVDVEGTPIPGGGCVLLLRDVGKEEDERRRLSRFASFVAHELRNPLAVAKARVELVGRDMALSGRTRSHGTRALESIDAAIAILERLEMYSRADSGRIEAAREPFQLRAALDAAIERLRARGSDRQVRIDGPAELMVTGDRQLTEQAITNLLINADRYSAVGEPIDVEVSGGDPALLRVIDAGPGVEDEIADRIFRDRVTAGQGLGLGLYLVAAIMQAQGGSVHLEQRRPRAVFALRWQPAPVARQPPREPAAAESTTLERGLPPT